MQLKMVYLRKDYLPNHGDQFVEGYDELYLHLI